MPTGGQGKPTFSLMDEAEYRALSFEMPGRVTSPPLFAEAAGTLSLACNKGLVINGLGFTWCYGMLLHRTHSTPWVAFRDPRRGAVTVYSVSDERAVGEEIPFGETVAIEKGDGGEPPVFYMAEKDDHRTLYFEMPGGLTTPALFAGAVEGWDLTGSKGLVITGKGFIWGYGMLLSLAHATPWAAFGDPRIGGAVVVESHCGDWKAGDVHLLTWAEIDEAKENGVLT